ncbi:unnamed protein product [Caenorhabditis auriculariae]|uniref:Uncharacterized protein n=1 Tax=Caenorhabditis auriculariae TaxID=2777116 RepID=A0A8S1H5G7_9PELO|nr:unnamed protein product [Caenorhabditis auriculariae]
MPEETASYYEGRLKSLDDEMTELFHENETLSEDLDNIDRRIDEEPTPALYLEKRRLEEAIEAIDGNLDSLYEKIEYTRKKFEAFMERQAEEEVVEEEPDVVAEPSSATEASSSSDSFSDSENDGF